MKCLFSLLLVFLSLLAESQNVHGVNWSDDLAFEQAKIRAQRENKYLFVDCYASWCLPCKQMDREVYVSPMVANLVNEKFVSIKIQMDKTPDSDHRTKLMSENATIIKSNFDVQAFPTLLFFDQNGIPIHKATGYHNVDNFVTLIKQVFDSTKQYYTIARNFKPGQIDTGELKGLARTFQLIDPVLSGKMAADYLSRIPKRELERLDNFRLIADFQNNREVTQIALNYFNGLDLKTLMSRRNIELLCFLNKQKAIQSYIGRIIRSLKMSKIKNTELIKLMIAFKDEPDVLFMAKDYIKGLSKKDMFLKNNLELLNSFVQNSTDKGFHFLYSEADKIDSIMGKYYSQNVIDNVIDKEEILPLIGTYLNLNIEPNWDSLTLAIQSKYSKSNYAERNVRWAQMDWYKLKNNTSKYIECMIDFLDKYRSDTTSWMDDNVKNNFAWDYIFLQSDDLRHLNAGIRWMEDIVRRDLGKHATYIDTYANLLYKVGQKEQALAIEREACKLDPNDSSFQTNLKKMEKGEPTWIDSASDPKTGN